MAYPGWEAFGQHFDLPLAQFIRIYQPAFFQRIGLRYVNIFSRRALELEPDSGRLRENLRLMEQAAGV